MKFTILCHQFSKQAISHYKPMTLLKKKKKNVLFSGSLLENKFLHLGYKPLKSEFVICKNTTTSLPVRLLLFFKTFAVSGKLLTSKAVSRSNHSSHQINLPCLAPWA